MRNVTIENVDMVQGCEKGTNESGLPIYAGLAISDIRYRNIRVEDPNIRLISRITQWNDYYAGEKSGSVSNIVYEKFSCLGHGWISLSAPSSGTPIDGLSFRGFNYRGTAVSGPAGCDYDAQGSVSNISFAAATTPVVSISAAALSASSSAGTTLTVSVDNAPGSALTIPLWVHGTARAGTDYQNPPSSVIINAGQTSTTITVTPLLATIPNDRATLIVEADHSTSRSYLLGANYRSMVTLITTSSPPINVSPTVSLTSPANGASFTPASSIDITVTASDSDGSVARVEFWNGSTKLGEDTSTPYAFTILNAAAGSYAITAKAVDNVGAVTASTTTTLTVNTVPPTTGASFVATYFNSFDLSGTGVTRDDATINFDWGLGSPMASINTDFSARWKGTITPTYGESYTFTAMTDDGVRYWIDGILVIDHWINQAATFSTGMITLVAGKSVSLVMEYYDSGWDGSAKLEWQSASQARQVVPASVPATGNELPAGWTAADVSTPGATGSTMVNNGTWTVVGSGADIWGAADEFQYVSMPVTGDVRITAKVVSETNANEWAKAGVMLRESTATGSRHAFTCVTATQGMAFQRRLTANGPSTHTSGASSPRHTGCAWSVLARRA